MNRLLKHLLTTTVKTLLVISGIFVCLIIAFIVLITINCNQAIEISPFIIKNELHSEDEVYHFVAKSLQLSVDTTDEVEQFIGNNALSCYEITSTRRTFTNDENYINANEVITCLIHANEPSFISSNSGFMGFVEVCFFDPRLRINFYFKQRILVDIRTDVITSGL